MQNNVHIDKEINAMWKEYYLKILTPILTVIIWHLCVARFIDILEIIIFLLDVSSIYNGVKNVVNIIYLEF